jgi:hypothetical protein
MKFFLPLCTKYKRPFVSVCLTINFEIGERGVSPFLVYYDHHADAQERLRERDWMKGTESSENEKKWEGNCPRRGPQADENYLGMARERCKVQYKHKAGPINR